MLRRAIQDEYALVARGPHRGLHAIEDLEASRPVRCRTCRSCQPIKPRHLRGQPAAAMAVFIAAWTRPRTRPLRGIRRSTAHVWPRETRPGLTVEIASGTHDGEERGRAARLSDHFAQVSARYRTLRELDVGAVRLISDVVARAADPGRPVRLVDIATGSGRYLDAVSHGVGSALALKVVSIGLDRSLPMLQQARLRAGHAGLRARHLVGAVETLPFRAASCDVMTCFNAVHHFDLARFAGEAARVLTPAGQLVVYTRTPEQNRRTIWGRHFPEFATRETRLHAVNEMRAALDATGAFGSVRAQMVLWRVTTSLARLVEQATHYHYSTFRLYSDEALRAAVDTFRQRVRQAFPDVTHITHDNDHVVVSVQRLASRG